MDKDRYIFIKAFDSSGDDIVCVGVSNIEIQKMLSNETINSVGFNTLGFIKSSINFSNLIQTPYFTNNTDGIYIDKLRYYNSTAYICEQYGYPQLSQIRHIIDKYKRSTTTYKINTYDNVFDYSYINTIFKLLFPYAKNIDTTININTDIIYHHNKRIICDENIVENSVLIFTGIIKPYNKTISTHIVHNFIDIIVFTPIKPLIYVKGISGLTNNIFQILTALPYVINQNCKLLLDCSTDELKYGTSNKFGRDVRRSNIYGDKESYFDNIFKKFDISWNISDYTKTINNDCLSCNIIDINSNDKVLIAGYSQNIELFYKYSDLVFDYFCFDNVSEYELNKNYYNIMIGIRIGNDFAHMSKLKKSSYSKAIDILLENNYHLDCNFIILSDSPNWQIMIDEKYHNKCTYINTDDISQIAIGIECDAFICSESTYHYIIALLSYIKNNDKRVVVFNDTDITNRKLSHILNDWIRIDY
jgi:hypothetical protein